MDAPNTSSPPKRRSTATLVGRLNLEWDRLRNDPAANDIAATWTEIDVEKPTSLRGIENAVQGRPVDAKVDGIIHALVRRATKKGRDAELAARVALQLMMPKAVLMARAFFGQIPDPGEREHLAVCCMYSAIRTHPAHITHHVPPSIAWAAYKAMKKEITPRELPWGRGEDLESEPHLLHPSEEMLIVLTWAVDSQVISREDAFLLGTRHGNDGPARATWKTIGDIQKISARTGLSNSTIRKRCSRARSRLTEAAAAHIDPEFLEGMSHLSPAALPCLASGRTP